MRARGCALVRARCAGAQVCACAAAGAGAFARARAVARTRGFVCVCMCVRAFVRAFRDDPPRLDRALLLPTGMLHTSICIRPGCASVGNACDVFRGVKQL